MQFPYITYGMALYRQYNVLTLRTSMGMRASGASKLRKFSHFHIQNWYFLLYSVNLVLLILCVRNIWLFSGLKLHLHVVSFITYGMALCINSTPPSHTLPPPPLARYARSGSVASLPRIITFSLPTHPLVEKPGDATATPYQGRRLRGRSLGVRTPQILGTPMCPPPPPPKKKKYINHAFIFLIC